MEKSFSEVGDGAYYMKKRMGSFVFVAIHKNFFSTYMQVYVGICVCVYTNKNTVRKLVKFIKIQL